MTNEQIDEMLAEIGRFPLITVEEERVLIKAVKEKGTDCNEMKQLEAASMRFVVSLINQYQHRGLSLEELIEVGKAALRNAAENYDLNSNCKFISYAVTQIRQPLEQAIAEKAQQNR